MESEPGEAGRGEAEGERGISGEEADEALRESGEALLAALSERLPLFVEQAVRDRVREAFGSLDALHEAAAQAAGRQAGADALSPLAELLAADVDAQRSTPLTLLRRATASATKALADLGVPPRPRDRFAEARFPEDRYDLGPASMAVLGEEVEEVAVSWGAAKAMAHRRRHLRPGAEDRSDA